jgi:hypothetical protein
MEHLRLVKPQIACGAVPTLREAEAAENTLDVDVDHQLVIASAGGVSLSDGPLPDVYLPDFCVPDVPLLEVHPNGSVGLELPSPPGREEVIVVVCGLGSGSCFVRFLYSNPSIFGTNYCPRCKLCGSLKANSFMGFVLVLF